MSEIEALYHQEFQYIEVRAPQSQKPLPPLYPSDRKQEDAACFSAHNMRAGEAPEDVYLREHFIGRVEQIRSDYESRSTVLCAPIPENGTIPEILNTVFNRREVSGLIEQALGTGERPPPKVGAPIAQERALFETEKAEAGEEGEDNKQEIRATGLLKFFGLIPNWLASKLDASLLPFDDRWLITTDVDLKNTGHIIISPAPVGMALDPVSNRRVIVTSFMTANINTNADTPYPMNVEMDYDGILGFKDEEMDIPGAGKKSIVSITEIYDSGSALEEQVEGLRNAERQKKKFMDAVVAEIGDDNDEGKSKAVEEDRFLEVEVSIGGHRHDEIELVAEQQVVVFVHPRHVESAKAQMVGKSVFLTASARLSFGLYNPGVPPEEQENHQHNDYLQFYFNVNAGEGAETLSDSIVLHGGALMRLAKMKLPGHLPGRKPEVKPQAQSASGLGL
ncbi:MAG: hypothetical protein IT559_02080 [Alphaproteobacteria bacterium]|nr:hypothetical protein [Alphaproteobacteria bacterium]